MPYNCDQYARVPHPAVVERQEYRLAYERAYGERFQRDENTLAEIIYHANDRANILPIMREWNRTH